jgi:hypothetical protein
MKKIVFLKTMGVIVMAAGVFAIITGALTGLLSNGQDPQSYAWIADSSGQYIAAGFLAVGILAFMGGATLLDKLAPSSAR